MADSAMMREAIPTFPRYGRRHASGVSRAGVVIAFVALIALSLSLVAAVRVFRMFQIPQRTAAGNCRNRSKVVRRWRGAYGPFESPCIPGIIPCRVSLPIRNDEVRYKHQNGDALNECADRDDQVHRVPTAARLVGVDAARHAEQSGNVHYVKRHVKAEYEKPEMDFAQPFVQHSSSDFRIPVIECSEEREQNSAHDHVVKMRHNKVRETQLPIKRG